MRDNTSTPPINGPRIHEVDGLRGIAILSVVIFHLVVFPLTELLTRIGLRQVLILLAYGVDLFFVISGFLIGSILLRLDGLPGIRSFYIRRVLRIWPLYYLLLFLVYFILPDKSLFAKTPLWSFPLFIFNFWESIGMGIHQALGPLWSIAVEEQFYLLGPILFMLFNKRQISFLLIACIILSPFLRLFLVSYTDVDIWRFTPARLDGICIGLLVSILLSSEAYPFMAKRMKLLQLAAIFLLAALVPSIIFFPPRLWASLGNSLVALAFGCVVLVVQVFNRAGRKIRFLNLGFLRYLGLRCYSIYLFHTFFVFIAAAIYDNFYVDLLIEAVLILSFAHFSWKYFELPLIKWGRRFSYGGEAKTAIAETTP